MKKLVSFVLSLALVGVIGLTAGCKKKEEAPSPKAPKTEAPAEQKAPAEEKASEEKPAEEKASEEKPAEEAHH